jgi:hypothetical protein
VLGRKLDSIPFSRYHMMLIAVLSLVGFVDGYDLPELWRETHATADVTDGQGRPRISAQKECPWGAGGKCAGRPMTTTRETRARSIGLESSAGI